MALHILDICPTCPIRATNKRLPALKKVPIFAKNAQNTQLGLLGQFKNNIYNIKNFFMYAHIYKMNCPTCPKTLKSAFVRRIGIYETFHTCPTSCPKQILNCPNLT